MRHLPRILPLSFALFAWASSMPPFLAQTVSDLRLEAIEETVWELETLIEDHDGLSAIRQELVGPRRSILETMAEKRLDGDRVSQVGPNRFNVNITPSAIKESWDNDYGEGDPVDVIVDFHLKLQDVGIDLIVVPVPSKVEAYHQDFGTSLPFGYPVSPGRVEAMLRLLHEGVEVVDVLPVVLDAMVRQDLPLYETSGHHLSGLGARLAGELIAQRLERYELPRDLDSFSMRRRTGTERIDRGVPMKVWQVLFEGKPYSPPSEAKVVVIGDSNAFAFGSASMASHIARASTLMVSDLSTSGGASSAHSRLAKLGRERLLQRRVVIWVLTSTHLERLAWEKVDLHEHASIQGLLEVGDVEGALTTHRSLTPRERSHLVLHEGDLTEIGHRLLEDGDVDNAIHVLEMTADLFPYSADAKVQVGRALVRAGREAPAKKAFLQALHLNPKESTRDSALSLLQELGVTAEVPEPKRLPLETMRSLTGSYTLAKEAFGVVDLDEGRLYYTHPGQPRLELHWVEEWIFNSERNVVFTFTPDRDSRDMTLHIKGLGDQWFGTRSVDR